jgi:hypothetical protein
MPRWLRPLLRFEARGRDGAMIDHPVFGRIKVVDHVRLNALHTAHHRAQLA